MTDQIKAYWDIILQERAWSWSVVCILYLLIGLFSHIAIFKSMAERGNDLPDRRLWGEIKGHYLRHCVPGWLFFIVPMLGMIGIWSRPDLFSLPLTGILLASLALAGCITSILSHLQAFGIASVITLRRAIDRERQKNL